MAGRTGITYEQVAAAADKLTGEGKHPSIDAVRAALGDTGRRTRFTGISHLGAPPGRKLLLLLLSCLLI